MIALIAAFTVSAESFVVDGLTYTVLSSTDKTVELTKPATGTYALETVNVPATVSNGGVTYTVKGIGADAFMSNATLVTINIADGVKYIGYRAFQSCSKLANVNMGNTIDSLAANAFYVVKTITTLKLSPTVKFIGKWGLRGIGAKEIDLGESLERVPDGMCWGCTALKNITIPDKTKYIGENAFASCSALDSIILGAGLDTLASKAFAYVSNCKKLVCRAAVPPVCMDEKSIVASYTKTPLWVKEASLALYQKAQYWGEFTTILPYDPSGSLNDQYFVAAGIGYEMISKDDFTVGVCHIDTLVYTGEVLVRPTVNYAGKDFNVIAVQANAFKNATGMTHLELPASIATIGNEALNGCTGLKYFISKAATPSTLGTDVFTGINFSQCKLFMPQGTTAAYAAADQWKNFTNKSIVVDAVTVDGLSYKCNNIFESTLDFTGAKGATGTLVIPDLIEIDGYPFTCTNIAGNAFYSTSLTGLKLPSTLKTISGSAFFSLGLYANPIECIDVPEGVTSIGSNAFYGAHVKHVNLPKHSLTNLANSAFYSCDIDGIEIPGSVGVINGSTFYGSNMKWVILGEGITEIKENAFWATHIGAIRLPSTMKKIGASAFAASRASSLLINDGLQSVDESAFSNCSNLYKIFSFATTMPAGLEEALTDTGEKLGTARVTYTVSNIINGGAAWGTVKLRSDLASWFDYNGVKYLATAPGATTVDAIDASYGINDTYVEIGNAFSTNGKNYTVSSLAPYLLSGQSIMTEAKVTFPMTEVPTGFVYNCTSLKKLTLPSTGIKTLGSYCFAQCDSLEKVDLPDGLETVGIAAFYYSGIKELTVPGTVRVLETASVSGCKRLQKLVLKDGEVNLLVGYLPTMFGNRPLFTGSKLDSITIGRNLDIFSGAAYGYSPFGNDSIVTNVVFTNAPTAVPMYILYGCKNVTNLTIGDGVKTINKYAFQGCASLDSVAIGKSCTLIGDQAFAGCTNVSKLYCTAMTPPACQGSALNDINKQTCVLHVPSSALSAYKAALQWKDFLNVISINNGIVMPGTDLDGHYVVYTINGVKVLDTYNADEVENLPAGLYIINGKKVIK